MTTPAHLHPRLLLLLALAVAPCAARERGQAAGSAIAPTVSLTPEVVPPASDVSLVACFGNGQQAASRSLNAGDALLLEFLAGSLASCELLPSESGFGDAPDWQCAVSGNEARVEYRGASRPWPTGEVACVTLRWRSPERPTSVRFRSAPTIPGSMAPPQPAAMPIVVAPSGTLGELTRAVRGLHHVTSSRGVRASYGDPPRAVPGAEIDVEVPDGSTLLVLADGVAHDDCGSLPATHLTNAVLLLDGTVASTRRMTIATGAGQVQHGFAWTWSSPPLVGGRHRVELAVAVDEVVSSGTTPCVGHPTDQDLKANLTVIELMPPR